MSINLQNIKVIYLIKWMKLIIILTCKLFIIKIVPFVGTTIFFAKLMMPSITVFLCVKGVEIP